MYRSLLTLILASFLAMLHPQIGHAQSCDAPRTTLRIMTASSLLHVLGELDNNELCRLGIDLRLISGSSATLSRQIEQGFDADIFISANALWMEKLDNQGLLLLGTRTAFMGNSLIKVSRNNGEKTHTWTTGDPAHVPLGLYAKEALLQMGQWHELAPKLVPAMNARGAVAMMKSGAVDMAVLYKSDVIQHLPATLRQSPIDPGAHSPIQYEAAILRKSQHAKSASDFLNHLRSPSVQAVFRDYGFSMIAPTDP